MIAKHGERIGKLDVGQTLAFTEGPMLNRLERLGKRYADKIGAFAEGKVANFFDRIAQNYRGQ
jgi:hypothetical protein